MATRKVNKIVKDNSFIHPLCKDNGDFLSGKGIKRF